MSGSGRGRGDRGMFERVKTAKRRTNSSARWLQRQLNDPYVRAAKSLGATDWTAFWRVYFPQSVPGIGAGSILVFILG